MTRNTISQHALSSNTVRSRIQKAPLLPVQSALSCYGLATSAIEDQPLELFWVATLIAKIAVDEHASYASGSVRMRDADMLSEKKSIAQSLA